MASSDLVTLPGVDLKRAARRAYERGRLRAAIAYGAAAGALALPTFVVCGRTPAAAACVAGLALVVAAGSQRGEDLGDGTRAGAVAGILPCLLPVLLRAVSPDLCDALFARGPWLCAIAGVGAGAVLGLQARRASLAFWLGAVAAFAFAASLGCLPAGESGFLGLAAGALAGGAPMWALRRAAS